MIMIPATFLDIVLKLHSSIRCSMQMPEYLLKPPNWAVISTFVPDLKATLPQVHKVDCLDLIQVFLCALYYNVPCTLISFLKA